VHRDDKKLVLDKDVFAAVWSPSDGYFFLVPWAKDNAAVPKPGLALMAALMRLDMDREFYDECVAWFESKKRKAS
jgi:hypothetical protein